MLESLFNNVAGLQAKTHTGVFLWITFFKTPPVADSALTYDLKGLKSRVNRHLLSFLNSFPIRFLFFSFLLFVTPCLVVAVQPCMDLIPIKKKTEIGSQLINSNQIFFFRPIKKSVLAIHDINGLSKITNLLNIKKSGTYRSSSAAPEVLLWKMYSENMLIRAYSLITNKITRSFNMVLPGGIDTSSRYVIKIY